MRERAEQLLENLRQQEAALVDQLAMTRGGIQTLEHLLAEDEADDVPDDEAN